MELLKLPYRMTGAFFFTLGESTTCVSVDKDAIRVPMFYAPPKEGPESWELTVTLIVAMLFGGIHCAGWNFPFPSHAELIIWRVSSLIIVVVPGIFAFIIVTMAALRAKTICKIVLFFWIFSGVTYVLARLTLFVEALIALRHPSPGAYAVVEWTALLLHM